LVDAPVGRMDRGMEDQGRINVIEVAGKKASRSKSRTKREHESFDEVNERSLRDLFGILSLIMPSDKRL